MQNRNNIDDLDYLCELGFETVEVHPVDLGKLKDRVRTRTLSWNSNGFFAFICIITGVFIGVNGMFVFYNLPVDSITSNTYTVVRSQGVNDISKEKKLDTVEVRYENFVRVPHKTSNKKQTESIFSEQPERLEPQLLRALNQSGLPNSEADVLYIPNSPVLYIHDYKVSDYHKLYFRSSKYVLFQSTNNLNAAMSSSVAGTSSLPQAAGGIYVHEIISEALLAFKNKDYPRAQFLLNELGQYNPSDINVLFYSGMSFYYRKNYKEAVLKLDECLAHPNNSFYNEAQFYKALSLYEDGNKHEAFIILRQIKKENGFYSAKAQQLLSEESELN